MFVLYPDGMTYLIVQICVLLLALLLCWAASPSPVS